MDDIECGVVGGIQETGNLVKSADIKLRIAFSQNGCRDNRNSGFYGKQRFMART